MAKQAQESCQNCGRLIGPKEVAHVNAGEIICTECDIAARDTRVTPHKSLRQRIQNMINMPRKSLLAWGGGVFLFCVVGAVAGGFYLGKSAEKAEIASAFIREFKKAVLPGMQTQSTSHASSRNSLKKDAAKAKMTVQMGKWGQVGVGLVRITSFSVAPVTVKTIMNGDEVSRSPLSELRIEIKNPSVGKILDYHPFTGGVTGEAKYLVSDDQGNQYRPISFGLTETVQGQITSNRDIYPGKAVRDLLIFEAPVKVAKTLTITFDGDALGGGRSQTFRVPIGK